jgi:hypothetical protein
MTTQKKNLTDYGNAMGFDVPAGATQKHAVEGEAMSDHEDVHEAEFADIPEHSNDALPVHKRSLPKVLLAIMAVTVLFGLPAYLFLSAASGGGGATNVVKVDSKDKNAGLKDPQLDEINRLKTDLAVGKQLASTTPTPSPSPSNSPAPDDKTTTAKSSPSPTATPAAAPTASTPPVVAKTNPPAPAVPVAPAKQAPIAPIAAVQAKPLPVAPTPVVAKVQPKPIAATNPPAQQVVAKASPKPVETVVAKAPPKPTEAQQVKPEPKAIASLAPKAIAKPEAKPVTPPVAVASNPAPAATPISWEQASAAGVYGGEASSVVPPAVGGLGVAPGAKDGVKDAKQQQRSSYEGAMSPTLLLAVGTNVKGHTLAPYTVGISKNQSDAAPLSIALDEPIELGKGYHLPVGTRVNFNASVRDNGSLVAISKNAEIEGVEVQLPEGAISLASDNNGLLMTKEISTGDGDLARADMNSSIWGGVAGAGKAILQSGGQTTTNTGLLGTTTTQTNNGSPNIIGGVLEGAFTPLATNGQQRAQQTAERIQQRSKLNTIDVNTKVKLFVNASIQVQIPVSGQQVGKTAAEDDGETQPSPQLIASNSVPSATENELPPQQMSVAPQSPTQTPRQAVLPPSPAQPEAAPPPPLVAPQASAVAPLPAQVPQQPLNPPQIVVVPKPLEVTGTTPLPSNPPTTRTTKSW